MFVKSLSSEKCSNSTSLYPYLAKSCLIYFCCSGRSFSCPSLYRQYCPLLPRYSLISARNAGPSFTFISANSLSNHHAIFTTRSGAKYLQFPFFRAFGKMASPLSVFSFLQRPDRQWIHLSFIGHGSVKQQVMRLGTFPYSKAFFKSSFSSIQVMFLMKHFYYNEKKGYLLSENRIFLCVFVAYFCFLLAFL